MILISYDIANDKVRARFQRLITKHGAIRLQYYVYEVRNTNRVMDNMKALIEHFSKNFSFADSVIIFSVDENDLTKYGNAIHRDKNIVFL